MDFEQIQETWSQMSRDLDQQKLLTNELIMKMAQQEYTSKINKVLRAESVGAIICFVSIGYILVNFAKFQSWQMQASAVILVITLLIMSVGSLFILKRMKEIDIHKDTLTTTIKKYVRYRKIAIQFQKVSIVIGFFVLFIASAVFSVLFNGKDLFQEISLHKMIFPMILGICIFGVIAFLSGKFYHKSLKAAQNVLEDIEPRD